MRETTHLHIYLERRLLCEQSHVDVQRNPCVTFFSTNPPFLIPPAIYHDTHWSLFIYLIKYISVLPMGWVDEMGYHSPFKPVFSHGRCCACFLLFISTSRCLPYHISVFL